MTQQFTYLFYDLTTGIKLAELPLSGVSFTDALNGVGGMRSTLKLTDPRVKKGLQQLGGEFGSPLNSAKTEVYVDMDGDLVWGGILWTDDYDGDSKSVSLGAAQHWSYFATNRRISWNADYTSTGVGPMDQLLIFKDLIDKAQAISGGNIGVVTSGITPSGQSISIKWDASQLAQIGQAATSLANQAAARGFDFAIDVAWDETVSPKVPKKTLTLSYPRRGRIAGYSGLSFDTANKWAKPLRWPRDGTTAANLLYGIGAGTGPTTAAGQGGLRSTQSYPPALTNGYPLLEGAYQRSDITDQTTLDNVTTTVLASVAYPVALPTLEFSLDMPDPLFGSYITGDDAEVVIPEGHEWFPHGMSEFKRVSAWNVSVADEGVSTVKLQIVDPPVIL